eukprot:symbB.v1.2.027742.t1/scaffold2870.1/size68455/7
MTSISAQLHLQHLRRTHSTARYWQESLLRALTDRVDFGETKAWTTVSMVSVVVIFKDWGELSKVLALHRNFLSAAWSHKEWDDGLVEHAKDHESDLYRPY